MKYKYVMGNGLAFNEASDMKRLSNYASQGWILESIVVGFFYKLRKDTPQDIIYSVDYQTDVNEEYFTIFKEAGWNLVVSVENQMHIFSAQAGTKPIYSDNESEIDKYTSIRDRTRKGAIITSIIVIPLIVLLVVSAIVARPIFLIVLGALIVDIVAFIFNFMTYSGFNWRVKQIKQNGECKSELENKMNVAAGVTFIGLGVIFLVQKNNFSIFFLILGAIIILSSSKSYKK